MERQGNKLIAQGLKDGLLYNIALLEVSFKFTMIFRYYLTSDEEITFYCSVSLDGGRLILSH
jgi:hypothetical protein